VSEKGRTWAGKVVSPPIRDSGPGSGGGREERRVGLRWASRHFFSTLSTGKRLLYTVGNVAAENAMQSSYL